VKESNWKNINNKKKSNLFLAHTIQSLVLAREKRWLFIYYSNLVPIALIVLYKYNISWFFQIKHQLNNIIFFNTTRSLNLGIQNKPPSLILNKHNVKRTNWRKTIGRPKYKKLKDKKKKKRYIAENYYIL